MHCLPICYRYPKMKDDMDDIQNIIWQVKFERKRNWLHAVRILEESLLLHDNDPFLLTEMGDIYTGKKLHKKAIEMYQKALEKDSKEPNLLFKIANCYLSMNEMNIALYYYDQMGDPFPEAKYNKAIALSRVNRVAESIVLLEELIQIRPDSELPYFFLIEQYLSQKEYDKAIERLNLTEQIFGKSGKISFLRGIANTYQKNWLRAFVEFQDADKLQYSSANFYRAYGITSEKIGKSEQAIEYLLRSIRKEPFNITTYLDLINIYIAHERLLEAHRIVEHARKIGPFSSSLSLIHNKILHLIKTKYGSTDFLETLPDEKEDDDNV